MATGGTANGEPLAGAQTVPATTGQPHLAVQDLKTLVSLLAARMVRGGRGGWVVSIASSLWGEPMCGGMLSFVGSCVQV